MDSPTHTRNFYLKTNHSRVLFLQFTYTRTFYGLTQTCTPFLVIQPTYMHYLQAPQAKSLKIWYFSFCAHILFFKTHPYWFIMVSIILFEYPFPRVKKANSFFFKNSSLCPKLSNIGGKKRKLINLGVLISFIGAEQVYLQYKGIQSYLQSIL